MAILLAVRVHAGVGDLDTSFGMGGLLRYPDGFGGLAGLPDGRLQLVAVAEGSLRVLRLVNGKPDATFGTAGVLETAIPGFSMDLNAVLVQGGYTILSLRRAGGTPWLMRIDASGRPDATFGPNGMRQIPPPTAYASDLPQIDGVAVGPGGAVSVLVKYFPDSYECADAMIVYRLGANGEPDVAFGSGGSLRMQVSDGCYWWGQTPIVALSGDKLLLGTHGVLLDGRGGNLALPASMQAALQNRRLLKIEDAGEYLYVVATTDAPTKPGLELNVSRWRRDLALDNTFGNSGTGYLDISLNDIPFSPVGELVAVTLLPPQSGSPHMYLQVLTYGHKAGEQGASEYASLAYRLRADGSLDRQLGTGGFRPGNSLWMNFVQRLPDDSVVADIGYGLATRLSGSAIESPGIVATSFSCAGANSVSELGGEATITLSRALGSRGAVSLRYSTQALTATSGVDYTDVQGTLSWADGESGVKTINVPITDDLLFEPDEQFILNVERVTEAGANLTCSKGLFSIYSNDSSPVNVAPSTPPASGSPAATAMPAPSHGGGRFDYLLCALLGCVLLLRKGPYRFSVGRQIKAHRKAHALAFAVQQVQGPRQ
ncbi:MAG: Calx-beta domain-containing protein [Pseudomonadota bacterium]